MLEFISKHFEFFVGLIIMLSTYFGYRLKNRVVEFDKERKIEDILNKVHAFLLTVKHKTATPIDDAIDIGVVFALHLLENKENLAVVSEQEKVAILEDIKLRLKERFNV